VNHAVNDSTSDHLNVHAIYVENRTRESKGDTQLQKHDTAAGSEPVERIYSVPRQPPCKKRAWAILLPAVMRESL
jgi:hypothetical protein